MQRFEAAKKASIFGIVGNVFLFIIKIIIGIISNSQAMLADAFNSASDIFSSIMTYIGNRISSKDADSDHNLGHGKAEYIYSMLISVTMMVLGVSILIDAFKSIFVTNEYNFSIWLIVVCIVTILTKLCLYIYIFSFGTPRRGQAPGVHPAHARGKDRIPPPGQAYACSLAARIPAGGRI